MKFISTDLEKYIIMNKKGKALYNKLGREELQRQLDSESFDRITVSMYKYVYIESPHEFRDDLFLKWDEFSIKGRIYIAKEGINAQFSCPKPNWEKFLQSIEDNPLLKGIPLKIAVEDNGKSFLKLTIKVRYKILADGIDDNSYDVTNVGKHLTAKEWNECMDNPDTVLIDVRNHYENEIGHFRGALCADSDTFREDLPKIKDMLKNKKDKKILLYCTGGIRCEKTSAYLKHYGFKDVNQLHGGVIDYARQIKSQNLENKFIGKNFVFDDRLAETISEDIISFCHQCGELCANHTNCAYVDCHLLFIQCDSCKEKYKNCCSENCVDKYHLPAREQKKLRQNRNYKLKDYKKSIRPKLNHFEVN